MWSYSFNAQEKKSEFRSLQLLQYWQDLSVMDTLFLFPVEKDKNGSEVFSLDAWMNHSDIIRKREC